MICASAERPAGDGPLRFCNTKTEVGVVFVAGADDTERWFLREEALNCVSRHSTRRSQKAA